MCRTKENKHVYNISGMCAISGLGCYMISVHQLYHKTGYIRRKSVFNFLVNVGLILLLVPLDYVI